MVKAFDENCKVRYFDITTGKDKNGMYDLNNFLRDLEYSDITYETELDKVNKVVMVKWSENDVSATEQTDLNNIY